MEISKEITFEAAHYLHRPDWDRERNLAVFRKCAGYREDDPEASHLPHGHSYRLRVTVAGEPHPATGFVMDFRVLKDILKREVHARLDHRFLNREVEPFRENPNLQTTVENLCRAVWGWLEGPVREAGARLAAVEIWETPDSSACYRGG